MSDRQKGLIHALNRLCPESEHTYCSRHLYAKFKDKFPGKQLKDLFWKAASTANKNEFESLMKKIETVDPKISEERQTAAEWLRKVGPKHWLRSHFSNKCKSDVLVNNLCESFNNLILEVRDRQIISMFDTIHTKFMTKIQLKKEGMKKYTGEICPNILKKIKKQLLGRNWAANWCGQGEFQVDNFWDKHVVDLKLKTCTCGMFQLNGYPCCHACATIATRRLKLEDHVDTWYKKEAYLKVYAYIVHGVPGQRDYIKTGNISLKPPPLKKKRGRPAKQKRMAVYEPKKPPSVRDGLQHRCTKCLRDGHHRTSCKFPPHPNAKPPRIYKKKEKKDSNAHANASLPQKRQSVARKKQDSAAPSTSQQTRSNPGTSQK